MSYSELFLHKVLLAQFSFDQQADSPKCGRIIKLTEVRNNI